MSTVSADGVSLASLSSVRLHLDSAFYDYEAEHGRPNRVPLVWLRKRFLREFPGELPGEDFDWAIRAAILADDRYDLFPDPAATPEELAGGVDYDGVVAVFIGRIDDKYLNESEAATAPSVPQDVDQPEADGSAVAPADFEAAFAKAFGEVATDGEGDLCPIAALRMVLDGYGDSAFDAGVMAVLEAGEFVLVEIKGYHPTRMLRAGALEVAGWPWYWITRRPSWGRGGEGGAA